MKRIFFLSVFCVITFYSFAQPNVCTGIGAGVLSLSSNTSCVTTSGTLAGATYAAVTGACGASSGNRNDVWYRFIPQVSSTTITVSGALTDPRFQVYNESQNDASPCTSLSSFYCSTSGTATVTGLTIGQRYLIRVYCNNNSATTFNICMTHAEPLPTRTAEVFKETIIASNLANINSAWELAYEDQEDSLWMSENRSYLIRKMHPSNGNSRTILNLSDGGGYDANYRRTFASNQNPWPQGGMMGLAIHPQFLTGAGKDFIYVAYVRDFVGAGPGNTAGTRNRTVTNADNGGEAVKGDLFRTFIVRFTYNSATKNLESPVAVCDTITGSNDHNSGRLTIAPMTTGGTDYFLFYSCGDMGAGQFYSAERTYKTQMTNSYEGKILRFNLEEDGDAAQNVGVRNTNYNRWIPNDNPYNSVAPVTGQSAVWNIGHRNVQGLTYTNGKLFGSSHGPFSDDEVNVLTANRNYGHPLIIGKQADDNYNGSKAAHNFTGWGNEHSGNPLISTLPLISSESGTSLTNYTDPVYTFFDGNNGAGTSVVNGIYTAGQGSANSAWPSIAPSGMEGYNYNQIPGWKNSLLLASLKRGYLMRIKPDNAGTGVVSIGSADTAAIVNRQNRYRDLAFDPNGWNIYASVDRSGSTSGPTATTPVNSACPGCIIKYTFLGYNPTGTAPNTLSTIPTHIAIDSSLSPGCVTATAVNISTTNNNASLWVPITGPNGNLIAEINANGNNLGNVATSFFTRTGNPVRSYGTNSKYLNRNVTINTSTTPSTAVSVRLYLTAKELADMIASTGSGVSSITDLGVFKNADVCGTAIASAAAGQSISGRYVQSSYGHAIQFNVNSFSSFYFFNASTTLPFDLITFTGKAVNDAAKLQWVVENEKDLLSYTVERSIDGISFNEAGIVNAKGVSGEQTYHFTDFNAASLGNVIYYRIRANEITGESRYTHTISVNFIITSIASVNIMPNPVSTKTNVVITAVADENVQLKVIDNTGRIIKVMNVNLVRGKNTITLDMSTFKAGMYYIDITGKAIKSQTKLIKQ